MASRLVAPLSLAALSAALLAFFTATQGLKDAVAPALLHGAVWLAVLATGTRLAAGRAVALPAGLTWGAAALVVGWGQASRLGWAAHPQFVGPAAYLEIEALFFFLLLPQLVDGWRRARQLGLAYLVASTLWATGAVAIICAARWGPESWGFGWHSARGFCWPTFNPNFTAMILVPGLLLAVACLLGLRLDLRARAGLVATIALHLAALGLLRSLGSVLGLAVGGAALLAMLGGRRGQVLVVSSAVVAVVVAGMVAADVGPAPVRELRDDVGRSLGMRQLLARQALSTWRETARTTVVGHGLGSYLPAAIAHRPRTYFLHPEAATSTPHPHGQLWKVLAERGLVGALLLALLYVALLWRARQLLALADSRARLLGAASLAALLALTTHGQVTIWLDHPLGVFLWWGWAGVLCSPLERAAPAGPPRPWLGLSFAAGLGALLGVFYIGFVAAPLAGAMDARDGQLRMREAAALQKQRQHHLAREQAQLAVLMYHDAVEGLRKRGETHQSLEARVALARALGAAGKPDVALRWLEDIDNNFCPGYGMIEWQMASVAALAGEAALSNHYFLRYFERNPVEVDAYEEWWANRHQLSTPAMQRSILARIEAGLRWLDQGRRSGQVEEGDRRVGRLQTIRARILLSQATHRDAGVGSGSGSAAGSGAGS